MITTTSLQHPTVIKNILAATRQAMQKGYGRVYNRKGEFMFAIFYSKMCNNFVVGSNAKGAMGNTIKKVFQNIGKTTCKPGLVALSYRFVG